MKKVYAKIEAEFVPFGSAQVISTSGDPCSPVWVANDTINWNGYTVCKQMIDSSNNYTGEYNTVPD